MKSDLVKTPADHRVNLPVMAGDIPVIKFDDVGAIDLIATGANYVLCRRKGAYPMIRTVKEWRALSDTPTVYAAADGEAFHVDQTQRFDPSETERS